MRIEQVAPRGRGRSEDSDARRHLPLWRPGSPPDLERLGSAGFTRGRYFVDGSSGDLVVAFLKILERSIEPKDAGIGIPPWIRAQRHTLGS
jgi:hypothetical protein